MNNTWHELENAFVEDHKVLSRGYCKIMRALEQEDYESAATLAEELDRAAGPHIEFEEQYLYPEVALNRGEQFARKLYHEHADAIGTLVELQKVKSDPDQATKLRWRDGIQHGLDHAASCGTLLSHLETLDPKRKTVLLERLHELRRSGKRWSQLHANSSAQ